MGTKRLTDEELQQALGDGDIPAHFVDLLAAEVRDHRIDAQGRREAMNYRDEQRRYEIARDVLAAMMTAPGWRPDTFEYVAQSAVKAADALIAALAAEQAGR